MKNQGRRKFRPVTGRDWLPSPTFVQQPQSVSFRYSFQTKPCQRCSQAYLAVRWQGPSGMVLPTPKPLAVRYYGTPKLIPSTRPASNVIPT